MKKYLNNQLKHVPQFVKKTIEHPDLYLVSFIRKPELPYILFIHGGPGFNVAVLEHLIEHDSLFNTLCCNILLYDQRGCGRSAPSSSSVSHQHNIDDLNLLISFASKDCNLSIKCLIGHSYGAKLLYDYYKQYNSRIPGVFVSTADSIAIPRLNNLLLDLNFLKRHHPAKYHAVLPTFNAFSFERLWEISEQLASVFEENKERIYFYWANLACMEKVKIIQSNLNLPPNNSVFMSVRKDLYSNPSNYSVKVDELDIPTLSINGAHDLVMSGSNNLLWNNPTVRILFQSSHYPHIEENEQFCEILNEFIQSN